MNPLLTVSEMSGNLPESDWLRFGILLLVLLAALQVVRLISQVNRSVLLFFFAIGVGSLLTTWVRNRNEPAFLTPVVEAVAPWFPTKLRPLDT